jgi:hypothetical protein
MLDSLYMILDDILETLHKSPMESIKILLTEEDSKQTRLLKAVIQEEDKKYKKETSSKLMIQKISRTPVHKLNNVMFKKMLIKLISFFYEEVQKSEEKIEDFGEFVYNSLIKKYMMRKAAENRFLHLLSSCMKYRNIPKVKVFSRFLGLFEEFDVQDLYFYLECNSFVHNNASGGQLIYSELSESLQVPYTRCLECIKVFSKDLPKESLQDLKNQIEKIKKQTKQNLKGVVDIDEFLEIILDAYTLNKRNTRNFMRLIYDAADLNNDGYLQYREFDLLVKFLSDKKFSQSSCQELFNTYAENFMAEDDEQVKAISFLNLCELDKQDKIFNQSLIANLTGVTNEEEALKKIKSIEPVLDDLLEEIRWRFSQNSVWEDHQEELNGLLKTLKNKFKNCGNAEEVCMALRLLQEDSIRCIVNEALKEMLPSVGSAFCELEESAFNG